MKVTELANAFAVKKDTVRYYTRIGLLRPSKSKQSGYKFYDASQQIRFKFILSARGLGFSVEDIEKIFSESDQGKTPCPTVRDLIVKRLAETEEKFKQMAALRERMRSALTAWDHKQDKTPCENVICHLIQDLEIDEK